MLVPFVFQITMDITAGRINVCNGRLFLGAVGAYDWSGTVAKYDTSTDDEPDIPDFEQVKAVLPTSTKASYLGYSVTSGSYEGAGTTWVATGAPRYLLKGAVVVYRAVDNSANFTDARTILPQPPHSQTGSYFGGVVYSADLDGDDKEELLVSAPMYIGADGNPDEGRVFVYRAADGIDAWASDTYEPTVLMGDTGENSRFGSGIRSGSRFGSAIALAGDLNMDGYNDVIIGAPMTGGGKGAVYVFHGAKDGIDPQYKQRISARDFTEVNLQYFGQSLQGDVDLDSNGYPDVAVGAPKSDTIAIFRARPVAIFSSSLTFSPDSVDVFECFGQSNQQTDCINVTACISVTGQGIEEDRIEVDYSLKLDTRLKRISLVGDSLVDDNTVSGTLNLTKNVENCVSYNLQVKNDIKDYTTAIPAAFDYSLSAAHLAKPLSSINDPNLYQPTTNTAAFQQNCGEDSKCDYDLNVEAEIILNDGKLMYPTNENKTDLSEGGTRYVINSGENNIRVKGRLSNQGEHAFETELQITYSESLLGQPIEFSGMKCLIEPTDEPQAVDGFITKTYLYTQVLGNILETGSECLFEFNLKPSSQMENSTVANFTVEMKATTSSAGSNDTNLDNNNIASTVPIIYRSDVNLEKKSVTTRPSFTHSPNVTEISDVSEIGPPMSVKYEIKGNGYATIPHSKVVFIYPSLIHQDENKRILYLHDYTCESKDGELCSCNTSSVNSYKFPTTLMLYPNQDPLMSTNFDCSQPSSNLTCETFSCSITNLKKDQTYEFNLRMNLWNATFNMPTDAKVITIKSTLEYSAEGSPLVYDKTGSNKIKIMKTILMEPEKHIPQPTIAPEEPELWMYILAIVGGLALLVLIGLILWKVGFFESEAQKQMSAARMKNEEHNNMVNPNMEFETGDD